MELEEAFSKVLKKYRLDKGLSQEELAHRCELDRTFISLLERGKRNPTLKTIFSICTTLEISPSDLIEKVENIVFDN